jgi:hypothetical protein
MPLGEAVTEPFTVVDLRAAGDLLLDRWSAAADGDWSVPAGTLEWSCHRTADHLVDCVFSYALFLASGKRDGYPRFGEVHAVTGAGPGDLVDGLRAVLTMLTAVIGTAPSSAEAVIWRRPAVTLGRPVDFAARGGLELVLHGHDVCSGLGVPYEPDADACRRLWAHTADWPGHHHEVVATTDAWADVIERSGRPRLGRQAPTQPGEPPGGGAEPAPPGPVEGGDHPGGGAAGAYPGGGPQPAGGAAGA